MINQKSIAILPFTNISNNIENDYFCDGISEEIINALTKIKGLKVTARTSSFAFRNKNVEVRHIGNELSVATILEGSVRIHKNKIRVNIQLIRTSDEFHVWSQNFDKNLEDIFELQDEISLIIAEKIRENFGHLDISEHISIIGTKNIDAYKLYLKGRSCQLNWNLEDYIKAIGFYKKSIALDPNFYDAYFSISRSYSILSSWGILDQNEGVKKAKYYLEKGFKINPKSYLGYFSKSSIMFWNNWDYTNGISYFKKTLNQNYSFAIAYEGISEVYIATNQLDKALSNINKAIDISPLSPNHYFTKANIYFLKKDYRKAITFLDESLKVDPNFALAIETKLACFIFLNDASKFKNYIATMPQLVSPKICELLFELINNKQNNPEINFNDLEINVDESFKSVYPWHFYFLIYSGKIELALNYFESKLKSKSGQLINFKLDPFLLPLRSHKKYQELEKEIFSNYKIIEINNQNKPIEKLINNNDIIKYINALKSNLDNERLYLNPNYTLKDLSTSINLHPNKLSWLLNEHIQLNFNEFINTYRLEHFKKEALKPSNSSFTLLGIAFESGFNSKTVFNTFFKKQTGMTPKQWVKSKK